ncbi:YggT family protein [Lactobacillus sp. ESL0791]|uniref:YggT family protein n=1 Tax=Lactobacillus sp. ESL0791 TaxID=2983234 RepID=UPI0023FA1E27|nr:YggT family protein [Lactobacillus sp. ESL0791]MDF7638813.1 YggT family protein [Lactobacillus sp. ESL0791]
MADILFHAYNIINWLIWLYCILIVIDAITSWLPFLSNSVLGRFLHRIVEPYTGLFRKGPLERLAYSTGIDISPIIALFLLYFIQDYALRWLFELLFKLIG